MEIDALKQQLDAIAWQEQSDVRVSEGLGANPDPLPVDAALRALAASLDEATLDRLEQEPGYRVWCLRLSLLADAPAARRRAARHLDSPQWTEREWARRIHAETDPPDPPDP